MKTVSPRQPVDLQEAARSARRRAEAQRRTDEALEMQAREDLASIVAMTAKEFHPRRIYTWGSLTKPGKFRSYSDIDLAVEGILDPAEFFRLLGEAQRLTRFPVDLVQLEKIVPEYADDIRKKGKLLYEHA